MGTVRDILRRKGDGLQTISASADVLAAARLMNEHHIGAVVVMTDGELSGILSERDIMTRVVASERSPAETKVSQVMTPRVLTCRPDTPSAEARRVMREKKVRHLPVVDGDRFVGMVSIGDLNNAEQETLVETIHYMETYISGGTASPM